MKRAIDPHTGRLNRVVTPSPHAISRSPEAIRKAKLDNLALVPGSLLPFRKQWQQLANTLPSGSTLIVLPVEASPARKVLERVSSQLTAKGSQVTVIQQNGDKLQWATSS